MDVATTHLDSLAHVFAVFVGLEIDMRVSSEIIPFAMHFIRVCSVFFAGSLSVNVY
jgi:hypothetical protein